MGHLRVIRRGPPQGPVSRWIIGHSGRTLLPFEAVSRRHTRRQPLLRVRTTLHINMGHHTLIRKQGTRLPRSQTIISHLILNAPLAVNHNRARTRNIVLLSRHRRHLLRTEHIRHTNQLRRRHLIPILTLKGVNIRRPILGQHRAHFTNRRALLNTSLLNTHHNNNGHLRHLVLRRITQTRIGTLLAHATSRLGQRSQITTRFRRIIIRPSLHSIRRFTPSPNRHRFRFVTQHRMVLAVRLQIQH